MKVLVLFVVSAYACIPDYHQCGGLNYRGESACCSKNAGCEYVNDYWWQCNPITGLPEPAATPAPTPEPTTPKPDCSKNKTRKSVTDPTNSENVQMFIDGVVSLKQSGVYDNFTKQHGLNTTFFQFHKNELFLPWHRWFVNQLEEAIRLDSPCFAMPYWDWSADAADPLASAMWSLIGEANSNGSCLQTGPFVNFTGAFDGKCIRRDTNASHAHLFTVDELANLVSENRSFLNFSHVFENTAHAMPHLLVAHQMSSMPSPDDPLFYLHHAFTDVVLQSFMRCHPNENASVIYDTPLPYADPPLTVRDVMAIDVPTDYDHTRLCR